MDNGARDRVILHSDLNSFYASVECRDNPSIADKPVAVTGDAELRHGIILAKNQLAKSYGVQTGEAIFQAKIKCPGLITVKADFKKYLAASRAVKSIYYGFTDRIEPFGIDECWLDVTASLKMFGGAEKIAHAIRERVKREVGLTVSIGVSFNKIFAKLGSDMKKPDAVTVITRENFRQKVWPLPVGDLLYVGRATAGKLEKLNVTTIGKLARLSDEFLYKHFGKHGLAIGRFARGEDDSPVATYDDERIIKSVGNGSTSVRDLTCLEEVKSFIYMLSDSVAARLRQKGVAAQGVCLHVRREDLSGYSVQKKLPRPTACAAVIAKQAIQLFASTYTWGSNVRALTVCAFHLSDDSAVQLSFDYGYEREEKLRTVEEVVHSLQKTYPDITIKRGIILLVEENGKIDVDEQNKVHPTALFANRPMA